MRPADDRSDEGLIGAFYDGDAEAFNVLTRRWWRRLIGYFHRLGFTPEDTEDLTLETLVRLYATRERLGFDVSQPLEPFLFKVGYHLAIEWWRREGRHAPSVDLWSQRHEIEMPAPAVPWETLADLYECIERLPHIDQQYVFLCGKHGLGENDHVAIAAILERSPARITQISHRALESLRRCLDERGF